MSKTDQLLSTKFYIPPVRPELIIRHHLLQQLNDGLHGRLTLISAPAGFGKTTLVGEWVAHLRSDDSNKGRRIAWLSLDENDNELTRFLTYFIRSLKQDNAVEAELGESVLTMLRSPQPPSTEIILTALINELDNITDDVIFILDDYHMIETPAIDEALTFLLDHLPPSIHLVITSRVDPSLPLPRLRARGQIVEFRAADLRFTLNEASEFFQHISGLRLSPSEVAALENRTEGWIAGLQLAALSMQGRNDVHEFINSFTGDHRYIVDYLVDEVLQRQPKEIRMFLLQTSILDSLNGSLCDHVTGRDDSNSLLKNLERANLFLVPLDNNRQWYRYHHLFSDVLRVHLSDDFSQQIPTLHRLASDWYEKNEHPSDSIRHALAAGDNEKAAKLVELAWAEMDRNRQASRWMEWAEKLPDEVVRARPILCIGCAWALLDSGRLEAGEARLRDAERWIGNQSTRGMLVNDHEEFKFLAATIATARAYHALAVGDIPVAVTHTRRALDILPEEEHLRRGTPAALLSLASWTTGDLETADEALSSAMSSYQKAGNILFAITGAFALTEIRMTLGRLRQVFELCHQALRLAEGQVEYVRWGKADIYTGLSDLHREKNELDLSEEYLSKSRELGDRSQLPRWRYRWLMSKGQLRQTQGRYDEALDLFDRAEESFRRGPMPEFRPVPALKARVWLKQGKLDDALKWAKERGLSPEDDLSFITEFEHITLARILISQSAKDQTGASLDTAIDLLDRLAEAAEKGCRTGSLIEVRVLEAVAFESKGNIPKAIQLLEQALTLGESEGYCRTFLDEGSAMVRLLSEAVARKILPEYTNQLLLAAGEIKDSLTSHHSLIDPLSEREQEILALIANGLKNKEIAEQMVISLNTVLYHTKNIYNKLGVNKRTQAVLKAQELNLL